MTLTTALTTLLIAGVVRVLLLSTIQLVLPVKVVVRAKGVCHACR